ncbi:MAG: sigma factor [Streptosporangiaceae bacterium]
MDARTDAEFSQFMHGRWSRLVRLGYGLAGHQGMAEDLAQTAMARAYASWARVRRADNPDAYLHRILLNAHRSRQRKHRVTEQLTDSPAEPAGLADPAASAPTGPT